MNSLSIYKKGFLLKDQQIFLLECLLILLFSIFPLFLDFPFTGNIYLSWEGAYRLSLGQVPYKDFGLPMGFGYWLIPALFFKIFGAYLFTLIKAQAFINIISALAFRSILKSFNITPPVRLLVILLFLISFSFINIWPWYNHTVIVFELIGLAFLLKYIFRSNTKFRISYLFVAAFFLFLSFFTKQDAGGLAFLIGFAIIISHGIYEKKIGPIVWFLGFYLAIALCIILPFLPYHIGYWFNYGQPPHYARLSYFEIINVFLSRSLWIKFYILSIVLILIGQAKKRQLFLSDKRTVLFTVLVIGILFEASIIQVTSYIPKNGNIFFHSFAIAYIFTLSGLYKKLNFRKPLVICFAALFILLWWSRHSWKYGSALIFKFFPNITQVDSSEISIRTFAIESEDKPKDARRWVNGPWKQFENINLPKETVEGIKNILNLDIVKEKGDRIRFLNMSELTPIEGIIGYIPETGSNIPLWYHLGVGMFEKQMNFFEEKIQDHYYDLVLFEYFPAANNFFPFEIRAVLEKYYLKVDSFPIPQRYVDGAIEVFIRKSGE